MTERALEFQPFGREQLAGAFEIHLDLDRVPNAARERRARSGADVDAGVAHDRGRSPPPSPCHLPVSGNVGSSGRLTSTNPPTNSN
jgi:hypothetical protein